VTSIVSSALAGITPGTASFSIRQVRSDPQRARSTDVHPLHSIEQPRNQPTTVNMHVRYRQRGTVLLNAPALEEVIRLRTGSRRESHMRSLT
jgi:hypothetical protein